MTNEALINFFSREIKRTDKKLDYREIERLLFAIAYESDREEFKTAAEYVLKRF